MHDSSTECGIATTHRRPLTAVFLPTVVAGILWFGRAFLARPLMPFLWWNLVLAWAPWILSCFCLAKIHNRFSLLLFTIPWILLLPNAPYLLTDLIHLKERHGVSMEFDALILFSFSLAGCVVGWFSLRDMKLAYTQKFGPAAGEGLVWISIFLTGFGVYLGRFLRLNSWDVLTHPQEILEAAFRTISQSEAVLFSFGFAALFGAGYFVVASDLFPRNARSDES